MQVIVFEDDAVDALGVAVQARPACDLTIGAFSLVELLGRFGPVQRVVRGHLERHLAGASLRQMAVWGGAVEKNHTLSPHRHSRMEDGFGDREQFVLFVNARAVPSADLIRAIQKLLNNHNTCCLECHGYVAIAIVREPPEQRDRFIEQCKSLGTGLSQWLAEQNLNEYQSSLQHVVELVSESHELFGAHERAIEGAIRMRLDQGEYEERKQGLYLAADAIVEEPVVVRRGPIVVEQGARIGPFVCLDGPIWIGRDARINPHAWIREATAIGRTCIVGGEVLSSVIESYSNKSHDGFLGHSRVGSWANIAAGTITSNLKVTYGTIRSHTRRGTLDSGRQFLGATIGDFAKTGIHTSISCGVSIGVAAMAAGNVLRDVPDFSSDLGGTASRTSPQQASTVLGRMMARRGIALIPADTELLIELAAGLPSGG